MKLTDLGAISIDAWIAANNRQNGVHLP